MDSMEPDWCTSVAICKRQEASIHKPAAAEGSLFQEQHTSGRQHEQMDDSVDTGQCWQPNIQCQQKIYE